MGPPPTEGGAEPLDGDVDQGGRPPGFVRVARVAAAGGGSSGAPPGPARSVAAPWPPLPSSGTARRAKGDHPGTESCVIHGRHSFRFLGARAVCRSAVPQMRPASRLTLPLAEARRARSSDMRFVQVRTIHFPFGLSASIVLLWRSSCPSDPSPFEPEELGVGPCAKELRKRPSLSSRAERIAYNEAWGSGTQQAQGTADGTETSGGRFPV